MLFLVNSWYSCCFFVFVWLRCFLFKVAILLQNLLKLRSEAMQVGGGARKIEK